MSLPVLILGAGGHGRVLAEAISASGRKVAGFLDTDLSVQGREFDGVAVLGDDTVLADWPPQRAVITIGIGSTSKTDARRAVYEKAKRNGYAVPVIFHPSALVSNSAELSEGVQIMAGAIVQCRARIGENTICNSGAIVEHDCQIGRDCHISPGVVLSGSVRIGDGCHIGAGAVVIQGICIGRDVTVGAGAVVIRNVGDGETVIGNPAKKLIRKSDE